MPARGRYLIRCACYRRRVIVVISSSSSLSLIILPSPSPPLFSVFVFVLPPFLLLFFSSFFRCGFFHYHHHHHHHHHHHIHPPSPLTFTPSRNATLPLLPPPILHSPNTSLLHLRPTLPPVPAPPKQEDWHTSLASRRTATNSMDR